MGDERGAQLQLDQLAGLVAIDAFDSSRVTPSHPIQVSILLIVLIPVLWGVVMALALEFSQDRPFIRSPAHRKR